MPNNKEVQTYNSGDLYEAYSLAYEQIADIGVMLKAISSEYKNLTSYLEQIYNVPDTCFGDVKRLIHLTNTMLDSSAELSQNLEQKYEAEYEGTQI